MTRERFRQLKASEDKEILCHTVHEESGDVTFHRGRKSLNEAQRTAYCVEVFFGLACNGGYQSLLYGAYTWTVPHSSDALNRVGLSKYADDFQSAVLKWFPDGIPTDPDYYDDRIEEIYDEFEASDKSGDYDDPFEVYEEGFWERYKDNPTEFRDLLHVFITDHEDDFVIN